MPTPNKIPVDHHVHVGDTLTPLAVTLKRPDRTAVDLTGKTVKFKLVDEDGAEHLAETTTGVNVTDADSGEVQFDFPEAAVERAGRYYGYFVVYGAGDEPETFPPDGRKLIVVVHGD